jgi:hypothetical protein
MKQLTKSELAALRTEYNAAIQFAGERNDVDAAVTWLERELLATRRTLVEVQRGYAALEASHTRTINRMAEDEICTTEYEAQS